jgi:3-oxoacyl-(acyl-carrier-protein) synthase III
MNVKILGTGRYLPEFALTNDSLSKMVDTNDEWIVKRTGIKERRINLDKSNWEMAAAASLNAIEDAGITPDDITMIICCTSTPDGYTPSVACYVQRAIAAKDAFAFDAVAACSGFVYSLTIAEAMVKNGSAGGGKVLVVGSENLSRITDYDDRGTCILFGDGAGAVVLSLTDEDCGIMSTSLYTDGTGTDILYAHSLASVENHGDGTISNSNVTVDRYMRMMGGEVLKFAIRVVPEILTKAMDKVNLTCGDVSHFLFHQANLRIITSTAEKMGIGEDKIPLNIEKYGNTSSATIPILLDEINRNGVLKNGDIIAMAGFGAGLTVGAAIIKWCK